MGLPSAGEPPQGDVLYTVRWNVPLREPLLDSPWLTPEEAAQRYRVSDLVVVDGSRRPEGELRPRWKIGVGRTGIRVQFFTPGGGSIVQSTDYDSREGRLWRWITTRYVYPDDATFYRQNKCVRMYTAKFEPDGTGTVEFEEAGKSTGERARMTDAPVSGFWLDWPTFGDWEDLANMDYGLPEENASTLRGG